MRKKVHFKDPLCSTKQIPNNEQIEITENIDIFERYQSLYEVNSHYVFSFPIRNFIPLTADKCSLF